MYFKTWFVPVFDRFVWFAKVLQENLKKLGNHTFLDNCILVLRIFSFAKEYSFSGISSFIKVDQHKICCPTIYISTIFDDIIVFSCRSPCEKYVSLDLPYFLKMPKGQEVAPIGLTTWSASRDYSIKKIRAYTTFRFHPVAPGLSFNIPLLAQSIFHPLMSLAF